jgi:hypothetical protein
MATQSTASYVAYTEESEWISDVRKLEESRWTVDYVALKVTPAEVQHKVEVR